MKLKCISPRLNFIVFAEDGSPRRVKVGDTFKIKAKEIPAKWNGLVVPVDDGAPKRAVTNPGKGAVNMPASESKS